MTTTSLRLVLPLLLMLAGCQRNISKGGLTEFPDGPALNMNVDLVLTPSTSTCSVNTSFGAYSAGRAFSDHAQAMAASLFQSVRVCEAMPEHTTADVVLLPEILQFTGYTTPSLASDNYHARIIVRWDLRDSSGRVLWSDEVEGNGGALIVTIFEVDGKMKRLIGEAMDSMFLQSYDRIMISPAVEAARARKGTTSMH